MRDVTMTQRSRPVHTTDVSFIWAHLAGKDPYARAQWLLGLEDNSMTCNDRDAVSVQQRSLSDLVTLAPSLAMMRCHHKGFDILPSLSLCCHRYHYRLYHTMHPPFMLLLTDILSLIQSVAGLTMYSLVRSSLGRPPSCPICYNRRFDHVTSSTSAPYVAPAEHSRPASACL
jgi:hypothetical protein